MTPVKGSPAKAPASAAAAGGDDDFKIERF